MGRPKKNEVVVDALGFRGVIAFVPGDKAYVRLDGPKYVDGALAGSCPALALFFRRLSDKLSGKR